MQGAMSTSQHSLVSLEVHNITAKKNKYYRQSKNCQLTNTFRAMSSESRVADTIVTTGCVLTCRVFRTPAVVSCTLVHVCR